VHTILRDKNYGFTGGVNPGIEHAIEEGAEFVGLFNNDAIADQLWLENLVQFLHNNSNYGIVTGTLLHADGQTIDSTADQYTIWGIPFPRGRDEPASQRYSQDVNIFGASGGASLYRVEMFEKIGLFDQDFFAYYEDIDVSFRAQLAGWKVGFAPKAIAYHERGATSARLAKQVASEKAATPFTTKQYMKNLPWIVVKDVPLGLMPKILPRFLLAYNIFLLKALLSGRASGALTGVGLFWWHLPKKLRERRLIQHSKTVTNKYIWDILTHDLPPNAYKLRRLRAIWWKLTRRA
jgi:GT2 family glycosyltransferase